MNKQDFEYWAAELRRQYDVQLKIDDSRDTKLGLILGFIFLVLSQIALRPELTGLVAKNGMLFVVFLGVLIAILISIGFGIGGLFVREYSLGPDIRGTYAKIEAGADSSQIIAAGIRDSIKYNKRRSKIKRDSFKGMLTAFVVGLIMLIILEVAVRLYVP